MNRLSPEKPLRCIIINGSTEPQTLESLVVLSHHLVKCGLGETTVKAADNDGIELTVISDLKLTVIGTELGTFFSAKITPQGEESKFIDYFIIALPSGVMSYSGRAITDYCEEFYKILKKNSEGLLLTQESGLN